jgi:hypothetical protein
MTTEYLYHKWPRSICITNDHGVSVSQMTTEYLYHKWPRNICITNDHGVSVSQMITEYLYHKWPRICSICRIHNPVIFSFVTYHRVCNKSNTAGVTCGAGTAYRSGAPQFLVGSVLHMHMAYISLSWSDFPELAVSIIISLIESCC